MPVAGGGFEQAYNGPSPGTGGFDSLLVVISTTWSMAPNDKLAF